MKLTRKKGFDYNKKVHYGVSPLAEFAKVLDNYFVARIAANKILYGSVPKYPKGGNYGPYGEIVLTEHSEGDLFTIKATQELKPIFKAPAKRPDSV